MISRAALFLTAEYKWQPLPAGYTGTLGMFDPTHGPNMAYAEYNGILEDVVGFGPGWNPWLPASRAEVAQMLYNAMDRAEFL